MAFPWVFPYLFTDYDLSVSDGITLADTPSSNVSFQSLVSDGLKGGDTPIGNINVIKEATEGLKGGDTIIQTVTFNPVNTDGIKVGDSNLTQLNAQNVATDGLSVGDTPSSQGNLQSLASDGLAVGDTPIAILNVIKEISDGFTVSDAVTYFLTISVTVTDGVKLSDSPVILKSAHLIIKAAFSELTQSFNKVIVLSEDENKNLLIGTASDSPGDKVIRVQRTDLMTQADVTAAAQAILDKSKRGLTPGQILIPPNFGNELYDVIKINDLTHSTGGSHRVIGYTLEVDVLKGTHTMNLTLGGV